MFFNYPADIGFDHGTLITQVSTDFIFSRKNTLALIDHIEKLPLSVSYVFYCFKV